MSALTGLRCRLCQIPKEWTGVQIQPASPGAAVHVQTLVGEDLRWTQASSRVQPRAVQGAAEVRGGGRHLLHRLRDGRGEKRDVLYSLSVKILACAVICGLVLLFYSCLRISAVNEHKVWLEPFPSPDGCGVPPRAQCAFFQSGLWRHQQLPLSGKDGQKRWNVISWHWWMIS